jgi:hypothetical protein
MLEIGELTGQPGPPTPAALAEVPARHDIQQLTPRPPASGDSPVAACRLRRIHPAARTTLANPPGRPAPPLITALPARRAPRSGRHRSA